MIIYICFKTHKEGSMFMRNMLCVLSAFLLLPAFSFAKDLTLNNGATFKDIKITQTTPLGIDFLCDGSAG